MQARQRYFLLRRQRDPSCGPVPYEHGGRYDPNSHRARTTNPALQSYSSGACAYDGECMVSGCGNHCVAWWVPVGVGTCEGYVAPDTFCGCVEHACTWFTP